MDARVHRKRGRRGGNRAARERRALESALRAAPTVGVKQRQPDGIFHPSRDRHNYGPDEPPPRDSYFIESAGVEYIEVCDAHFATGHGYDENCPNCRKETIPVGRRA